jgi:hypothetical protein
MKLGAVVLFVLLYTLPLCHAETSVYTDWQHSGDSFTITLDGKEEIHYITYFIYERKNDKVNKLFWKRGTQGFTLMLGDCKTDSFYKYCFNDTSWKDSVDGGQLIYQHGDEYPGVKITISKFGPDIQILRESTEGTSLNIYQETKVNVKLTNIGDRKADLTYQDFPPSLVELRSYNGFTKDPVHKFLEWEGFLYPEEYTPPLHYVIKPVTYESFMIPSFLNFTYEGKTYNATVPTLSFSITKPWAYASSLSPGIMGLYETATLTVSFGNDDKYRDMAVFVRLFIPKELDVLQKPTSVTKEGDYYIYRTRLGPQKDYEFYLTLRGGNTGNYNITTYAELILDGELFTEKNSHPLSIEATTLTPKLRLVDNSAEGGTKVRLVAELKNMDDFQKLRDITGVVSGPLLPSALYVEDAILEEEKLEKYVDEYLTTPITNTKLEYTFWFNGTYKLVSEEPHNFSTSAILTVNPAGGDHFEITQEASDDILARGDNMTIKVFVKNLKDYGAFRIDVKDELSPDIKVIAGTNKNILDLEGQEKKQVYLYMVEVPKNYLDSSFDMTTKIIFQEYTLEQAKTITVIAPVNDTPPIENTTIVDGNSTDTPLPDDDNIVVTQKKEGFFIRLVNALTDFFDKIF